MGRRQRRLRVIEATSLDSRRRLVLVGRDDRAHLILLGPGGDLVVERGLELQPEPYTGPNTRPEAGPEAERVVDLDDDGSLS